MDAVVAAVEAAVDVVVADRTLPTFLFFFSFI